MSRREIYKLVDPWKWKTIFGVCLIEVGEIDADLPLAIMVLN